VRSLADAYSAGAEAWADGPHRVYGTLADLLVASSPIDLRGCRVLDLGTGTGAASRPAVAAGADVVAVDTALGMLQFDRDSRPPAIVGDALALPLRPASFDAVVAAFSLNHLDEPARAVREVGGVIRSAGILLASVYANDDDHPVKRATEQAMAEWGWQPPEWYSGVKRSMEAWGTVADVTKAIERGGLRAESVERREIAFPDFGPDALVGWRLGMAQFTSFVETLDDQQRRAVGARCRELLGDDPDPLVRRVIFIAARAR
jgi:ubiquinone/menaquinone biosynthesis C-methylase UbiE